MDKGAEWHEQLNSFLIKHNLSVFHKLHVEAIIDRAKLQHVEQFSSNSTSSSIIVYRTLQPEYRYTCLLSDVFQIEGCLAGLDVGAMVCMLTQGDGWILKGRTGCVRCATHLGTWKMSSISCLVAQLTVMLDKSMPVFFSRPLLSQTFSLTLNQMHVVVSPETVFHLENLMYPPDISMNACLYVVSCLLAPGWSPGH